MVESTWYLVYYDAGLAFESEMQELQRLRDEFLEVSEIIK